ncbi:MAG: response regulator [Candidatus Cryptobacteroides sp.]
MPKSFYQPLLLLFCFIPQFLFAEVKYLTNRNGLSNSSVTCIYQDSEDYLWMGTWDGLNRYNGRDFEIFRPSLDTTSISGNVIRDIMEDHSGNLWVCSDRGIDRFVKESHNFKCYFMDILSKGIRSEHSFYLVQDAMGQLYAGVSNYGIYRYSPEDDRFSLVFELDCELDNLFVDSKSTLWYVSDGLLNCLPADEDVISFEFAPFPSLLSDFACINSDGTSVWLAKGHRLSLLNLYRGKIERSLDLPSEIGRINCVLDRGDILYIGGTEGLLQLSGQGSRFLLQGFPVLSLFWESDNLLWAGSDMMGIAMISSAETPFHSFTGKDFSFLSKAAVRSFYEETPDRLWLGTKGNGMALFSREQQKIIREYTAADGLADNNVYAFEEGDEVIWIGTDGDGLDYYDKSRRTLFRLQTLPQMMLKSVYSILQTERNVVWVGTSGHGLYRMEIDRSTSPYKVLSYKHFSTGQGLESNVVYSIVSGRAPEGWGKTAAGKDVIWVGTRGGGLSCFGMDGERIPLDIGSSWQKAFSDITSLLYDKSNSTLWIGTGMGVYGLHPDGNIESLDVRHVKGTSVHSMLQENDRLWLGTNNGLVRIDKSVSPFSVTRYSSEDGLQDNEFSDGACFQSAYSEDVFFGGISGFTYFDPSKIGCSEEFPRLNLDGVFINNERSLESVVMENGRRRIVISPQNKSFSLKFSSMDFLSGERCELAYILEPYLKDWVYVGTSNTITFTNVPHGIYELKVRNSNADKVWNSEYFSIELRVLARWYETLWARVLLTVLVFGLLFLVGLNMLLRRKSRLKVLEEEAEKNRMTEIHEAKLRFFTNIAHEFSNSLTLIYGPCKELQEMRGMPSDSHKYLNYIESNSSRMLSLIQQLIAFRKAESGHLRIVAEEVDVNALLQNIESYFKGKLEELRMQLLSEVESAEIKWVTDRDCLEKIIFNLLSNATKYTPPGGRIKIEAGVKKGLLRISVTNYGIGIPQDKREAIFDRFEVLDRFESGIRKGKLSNGIGLSLCKNLVELMEGRIWIDSDSSSYTSFRFELPMLQKTENAEKRNSFLNDDPVQFVANQHLPCPVEDEVEAPAKAKRILIVDDDAEIRGFIRSLLAGKYICSEAGEGAEALVLIKRERPDLVISDIVMPGMDGFRLLKSIRENKAYEHIPFILLTSNNTEDNERLGLEHGADSFIAKPFSPDILLARISNLIERDEAVLRYSNSSLSALDRFRGKEVSKEDGQFLEKLTALIDKYMDSDKLCMDFLADEMAVSKMQMYRKVKQYLEITPVEYIKLLRLEKAEKLLVGSNRTVQQIMFDCGFNSKTYFYREFSKKYGTTPKQYRESSKIL